MSLIKNGMSVMAYRTLGPLTVYNTFFLAICPLKSGRSTCKKPSAIFFNMASLSDFYLVASAISGLVTLRFSRAVDRRIVRIIRLGYITLPVVVCRGRQV